MPDEVKAQMVAFKIADILSVYGEYTVADVIYTVVASNADSEEGDSTDEFNGEFDEINPDTSAPVLKAPEGFMMSLIGDVIPMLNTTFADMGIDIYGFIEETLGIEIDSNSKANKLEFSASVEFDTATGSIKLIDLGMNVDLSAKATVPGEYDEALDEYTQIVGTANVKAELEISVKEISGNAAAIEAPSADKIEADE